MITVGPPPADELSNGADRALERRHRLARMAPTLILLTALNGAVIWQSLPAQVLTVAIVTTLPGALVLVWAGLVPDRGERRLAYAVALSVALLLVVGLLCSTIGPLLHLDDSLARAPVVALLDIVVFVCCIGASRTVEPLDRLLLRRDDSAPTWAPLLVAVPLLCSVGALRLNGGHGSGFAVGAVTLAVAVLAATLLAGRRGVRVHSWVLYMVTVGLLLAYSLRSNHLFGWDIQQEFHAFSVVDAAGRWSPNVHGDAYGAMLSITALPRVFASLTGLSGLTVFKVVYPALFGLFPVLVYSIGRRWVPAWPALVGASVVAVQGQFFQQLPALARQEIGLLFFASVVCMAFDEALPTKRATVAASFLGLALVVSHYSTAYVAILLLAGAMALSAATVGARPALRSTLGGVLLLSLVAGAVLWYGPLTHAGRHLVDELGDARTQGPQLMPNRQGRSPLDAWLSGATTQPETATLYYEEVARQYRSERPWVRADPTASRYRAVDASVDLPSARSAAGVSAWRSGTTLLSQLVLLGSVLGVLVFAWRYRRDDRGAVFAALGLATVGLLAIARVSGSASEAYNLERLQLQGAVVMSPGLAFAVHRLSAWRPATRTAFAPLVVCLLVQATGLASVALGGMTAPANLRNAGEDYERFYIHDSEIAAAVWLAAHRDAGTSVHTDRYGVLRLWASTDVSDGVLDALTPQTIDRNGYVFASWANVVAGRARGAVGGHSAAYRFPADFLARSKNVIYATERSRVYR